MIAPSPLVLVCLGLLSTFTVATAAGDVVADDVLSACRDVSICPLTAMHFINVTATTYGNPAYWIIRIRAPGDPVPSNDLLADVATELAPSSTPLQDRAIRFGELLLDNVDAWVIADGLGLQQFPHVLMFSGKTLRALGPRGGTQYGRVLSLPRPIALPNPNAKDLSKSRATLKQTILANVPSRYLDGVTTQHVDALNFVFSRKEMYQLSTLRKEQHQLDVISLVPQVAVVLRLRLSEKGDESYLAFASAAAAAAGSNAIVFVTEDPDVASRFHITDNRQAAAFAFPFPEDVSVPIAPLSTTAFTEEEAGGGEQALATFIASTSRRVPSASAESLTRNAMKTWVEDVNSLTRQPLRRIDSQHEFFTNIQETKFSIVVLFFLRESDDFFMKGYKVAEELAKFVETSWASTIDGKPHPLLATRGQMRFDVYWVDAEAHKAVAAAFKTTAVPSVAFLYALQDGRRGVRYVQGGKKSNEFPTTGELVSFMTSSRLLDTTTQDLFPLDLATVAFSTQDELVAFYRSKSAAAASKLRVTTPGARPRVTDRKVYLDKEVTENTFVSQMVEGKIKLDDAKKGGEGDASSSTTSSSSKKKKLSPKAEAKKLKKAEAEKKKIEAELAEKKRIKEERIQKKADEDSKRRAEELEKAKATLREERKQQKGDGTGSSGNNNKEASVERPKFHSGKPPKNRHLQRKEWDADRKRMIDQRLKNTGGVLSFNRKFEL